VRRHPRRGENLRRITLPTRLRPGYFFGADEWAAGEFFRATITDAAFH
jgi:hypothetical protein